MAGFELRISGVGSNCATITAPITVSLSCPHFSSLEGIYWVVNIFQEKALMLFPSQDGTEL